MKTGPQCEEVRGCTSLDDWLTRSQWMTEYARRCWDIRFFFFNTKRLQEQWSRRKTRIKEWCSKKSREPGMSWGNFSSRDESVWQWIQCRIIRERRQSRGVWRAECIEQHHWESTRGWDSAKNWKTIDDEEEEWMRIQLTDRWVFYADGDKTREETGIGNCLCDP